MPSVKEQVRTMIEALDDEELRRVLEFVKSLDAGTPREALGSTQVGDRITVNPRQCGGKPCVRGMRMTVADVLEYLASGMTRDEILRDFPDLEPADIQACLAFAASRERNL